MLSTPTPDDATAAETGLALYLESLAPLKSSLISVETGSFLTNFSGDARRTSE
jgi:hypothetical protein